MENKEFMYKVQNRQFAIDCSGGGSGNMMEEYSAKQWIKEELEAALSCQIFGEDIPICSKYKILGAMIVFCKKAVRKLLKIFMGWYILPIYERQRQYNASMLNASSVYLEWMSEMELKLEELEKQNKELRKEVKILCRAQLPQ